MGHGAESYQGRLRGARAHVKPMRLAPLVTEAMRSIAGFDKFVKLTEKKMVKLWPNKLPVAAWVAAPEQRGFGLQSLAILIGECGDLAGYANPGNLAADGVRPFRV